MPPFLPAGRKRNKKRADAADALVLSTGLLNIYEIHQHCALGCHFTGSGRTIMVNGAFRGPLKCRLFSVLIGAEAVCPFVFENELKSSNIYSCFASICSNMRWFVAIVVNFIIN